MTEPENGQQVEQRSSIKAVRNAKGEPQFEIKVVEGTDNMELDRIRKLAVDHYHALARELGGTA